MEKLANQKCIPCRGGLSTLSNEKIRTLKHQVPNWQVKKREGINQLERQFKFKNFADALAFTNQTGDLAETEAHHPAILTEWGKTTVTWWTHEIGGLHQNDFIMAAKSDQIYLNC
jgi:4a-hydroxytetrahydrobiopterin dehydratase